MHLRNSQKIIFSHGVCVHVGYVCYVYFNKDQSINQRSVYSHDRPVLWTPVGYSDDDQSEAR